MVDTISIILSVVALIVSAGTFVLFYKQFAAGKPKIEFLVSKAKYEANTQPESRTIQPDLKLTCEVIFRNEGNASGSITDVSLRTRYSHGIVETSDGAKLLGSGAIGLGEMIRQKGVIRARPSNFDNVIPIELSHYGSKRASFEFAFKDIYPYYLDRAIVPIDPDDPDRRIPWQDLPIVFEFTVTHSSGTTGKWFHVYNSNQPESMQSIGYMNEWDSLMEDLDFAEGKD